MPNTFPTQFSLGIILISAIALGSLIGLNNGVLAEVLSGWTDYTVLILVFLLFFELRPSSWSFSKRDARFLIIAWAANFIIIPTIGFIIASLFLSGKSLFFIGLFIYFLAPCTDWFLGFTRLANGNTRLGTTLLPINLISQLLLLPLYLSFLSRDIAPLGLTFVGETLWQWFIIPICAAFFLHQLLRVWLASDRFERLLATTGAIIPWVISALIVSIFAGHAETIAEHWNIFLVILVAVFVFFVTTYWIGEYLSRFFKLAYPEQALLTMTTAARNAPLMLGITALIFPDQPLIAAALIIGMLVEFPHLTALTYIMRRKQASLDTAPSNHA